MNENPKIVSNLFEHNFDNTVVELFQNHYTHLCRRAYRIVNNEQVAEDLVQDVFFKLWENRKKIVIKTSIGAYLNRMVFNESISYLRKNKDSLEFYDEVKHEESNFDSEQNLNQKELQKVINEAIGNLPPRCKTIFMLSRVEELSYKEIAEKLEISVKTVENQMGKALKLLRTSLKYDYLLFLVYFSTKL